MMPCCCPIPRGTGMLSLLRNYVDALFDDPVLAMPEMRQLIVAQLCDLVAVTLGATRDATAVAEGRGIRAARLRAIKSDIEAHLADGDLSPGAVARRQKVSDSYIRKLFEGEGTSFSQFVLVRRLVRAHRMLTDRRWAEPKHRADRVRSWFWRLVLFQSDVQALLRYNPIRNSKRNCSPEHLKTTSESGPKRGSPIARARCGVALTRRRLRR